MNILVLNPPTQATKNVVRDALWGCWCKGKRIAGTSVPPLSQVLTATLLKNTGHQVTFLDALGERLNIKDVVSIIKNFQVAVVQTSTMTFKEDSEVLFELKKNNPELKTVIYGSHPTFMPDFSLKSPGVDIIIRKEHEFALRDLINSMGSGSDWKSTPGVGFKINDKIILNPDSPFIENLDELPFPDRSLLSKNIEYFNPIVKRLPYTTCFTSRGCPGRCSFCTAPEYMGKTLRCRTAENVIEELKHIQSEGFKEVFFRDETFTAFTERNIKICQEILNQKIDLTWICNARVGTVDKSTMQLMKKAGCHMIRFGVESGAQEVLNKIKKGITIKKTQKSFEEAREAGLDTHAHVMIGLPLDTEKTINDTIKFVKEIKPTTATFGICTPYPGTELFEEVKEVFPEICDGSEADLKKLHTTGFYNQAFCEVPSKELEKLVRKAYFKFYFRPIYWWWSLKRINSFNELKRMLIAGTAVLDFSVRGD